jgi:hypothetical protein
MFLIPVLSYASTFYKFRYFYSFLKQKHPQVVTDVPHRINKRDLLPVLIIFKNGDHYPCNFISLEIFIDKEPIFLKEINQQIDKDYQDFIEQIDISSFESGFHQIDVKISYQLKNRIYHFYNDNYKNTSRQAFKSYFAEDDLPKLNGFISGDMHNHSNFTNDQIEFGASLQSTAIMADALGLNIFAATDHSYDLDDYEDNFLKNDPELKKWNAYWDCLTEFNQNNKIKIIPGEEVSVKNNDNKNVHLLVFNSKKIFVGSGDSGEKWFRYYSEHTINDVINQLPLEAIAFAAHPADSIPAIQKLFLNRGEWTVEDASNRQICGLQIFNGHGKSHIPVAINYWVSLLLKGYKSFALAGNDAHGNFACNKSISIPFLKIRETETQLFGQWRTDLFLNEVKISISEVIKVLKKGHYTLSNGPAINFQVIGEDDHLYSMGESLKNARQAVINFKSNHEFGVIKKIKIHRGIINEPPEQLIFLKEFSSPTFSGLLNFNIEKQSQNFYLRAELESDGPKGIHFAFSNPIWIEVT